MRMFVVVVVVAAVIGLLLALVDNALVNDIPDGCYRVDSNSDIPGASGEVLTYDNKYYAKIRCP